MDNLNNLKATWLTADTGSLPDVKTMTHVVKSFRNSKIKRKQLIILSSILLSLFFITIMYLGRSHMATTIIAQGLFVLCLLILAYTNIRSVKRFYKLNECSNREFIQFLEQTRRNQIYYYRRTQIIGMALYSLALPLYLFEFVHRYIALAVTCYLLLAAMLILYWTVMRPRAYQKEALKLQRLIDQTKQIANQFN
jgi:hypothetical protein